MQAVVLTQEDFNEIQETLTEIKVHIKNICSPAEHFVDNKSFMDLMGISSRTAQIWRDEGKIGYSKTGNKIYYRMSDIETFLEDHHQDAFPYSDDVN